jgi:hypothetical protein
MRRIDYPKTKEPSRPTLADALLPKVLSAVNDDACQQRRDLRGNILCHAPL